MEEFSRRRRHEPDETEESIDYKRLRGVSGVDIGGKLVQMISNVHENVSGSLEETLADLHEVLSDHLEPYEGQIINILCECAMYFPERLTIFTTLIGLINAKSSAFGENIILKLVSHINDALVEEKYDIVLRLTTFLSDLGNVHVLTVLSILEFLQEFVDLAVEENVRSDYFIYIVLHSLPWIGAELAEKKPTELEELLSRIQTYLNSRKKLQSKMLQVWTSSTPLVQEDYLDCLFAQIQKQQSNNWIEHHIERVYATFRPSLTQAIAHNLPNVDPTVIVSNKNMPLPQIVFRLFDSTDCSDDNQTLAPVTSIERFLIEEDLNWIIDNNYTNWRLCAKHLLNYHRREFVPLSYAIIEVIFGQLFRLPQTKHSELFYGTLLLEMCRSKPDSMPQVLAQAAELLYQRVDTMQPICLDRFVNWFSFHLSNFQYRWSWSDWADCLNLDSLHSKLIFVREVIEKCMRLSYYKKVLEFLPIEFHSIVPPEPNLIDVFNEAPYQDVYPLAKEIQSLIEAKKPNEVFALLKKDSDDVDSNECNPDSVAVFTAVLLKLASRTFSHSFTALTKYHKVFCAIVKDNEEMQSVILRTLYDCWSKNKQVMTILVDKMLKMQIVDPAVVQAWVFCDDMKREFKRSWVWEVLHTAINRLECHYAKFSKNHQYLLQKIEKLKKLNNIVNVKKEGEINEDGGEMENDADGAPAAPRRPKIIAPDSDQPFGGVETMETELDYEESRLDVLEDLEKKSVESLAFLEEIEDNLRNILLSICHKFTLILTEHLLNCETDGTEVETDFYNYVSGRFRHIFLAHTESMWKFAIDLDKELFSSPTIEPKILEIFDEFRAIKA